MWTLKPFPFSSFGSLTIQITSLRAVDSEIYLASMVLSAINYFILLAHIIVQPTYIITYPVRKWLENGLSDDRCCHDLTHYMSTYHSNTFALSGLKVMPCYLVFDKYPHIIFTSSS